MGKTTTVNTLIEMGKAAYLESLDPNYTLPAVFQNTDFEKASTQQKQMIAVPYIVHLELINVIPSSYISKMERQFNIERQESEVREKKELLDKLNEAQLSALQEQQTKELNALTTNLQETKQKLDQLNQAALDKSIQSGDGDFNEIIRKWNETKAALDSSFQQQIKVISYWYVHQRDLIQQKYLAQMSALDSEYDSKIRAIQEQTPDQKFSIDQLIDEVKSRLINKFKIGLKNAVSYHIDITRRLNLHDLELRSTEILRDLESSNYDDLKGLSLNDAVLNILSKIPENSIMLVIDEYDDSIASTLKYHTYCKDIMLCFREFFSALKSSSTKFKFSFVTGITSYPKWLVFGDCNQFYNISHDAQFSNITGFTEDEIKKYFAPAICRLAVINDITPQQVLDKLKYFYEGYCFGKPCSLDVKNNRKVWPDLILNPISVKYFLMDDVLWFKSHWISTGGSVTAIIKSLLGSAFSSAEFVDLINRAKSGLILPKHLDLSCLLSNVSLEDLRNALPVLLFQAGYLSIDRSKTDSNYTVLTFPNKEVGVYWEVEASQL